MTKADLVERVPAQIARTAGPSFKKDCARVVELVFGRSEGALSEQHNIEIRGFGTFKIRQRKTRMGAIRAPVIPSKWRPGRSCLQAQQGGCARW